MKSLKEYIRYKIQPQKDGTYVILQKDLTNKQVDIHSHHDTYEEAEEKLEDLKSKPSQAEAMKMIHDLRLSMDAIKQ